MKQKRIIKQILCSGMPILLLIIFCVAVHRYIHGIALLYDYYFSFFVLPFLFLILLYLFYRGSVKIKILCKNDEKSIDKTIDLFELQTKRSKNIQYAFSWIIVVALICVIVFTIVGFFSVPATVGQVEALFTSEHLTNANLTGGMVDYQNALSLLNSSVLVKQEYYQNHSIVIRQEVLTSCPKSFIDTYYESNCKNEVFSYHKNSGKTQEFSTGIGYGQLFISDEENEIHIVMRNKNNLITLVVFIYPTEPFKVVSQNEVIELCSYILQGQSGDGSLIV